MLSNMSGARSRKGCDGMAQAVLVMDMPENCFKCKLQNWANCKITNKCHVGECRPDWCPLRELPEKIPESKSEYEKVTTSVKRIGWNECLDTMLENGLSDCVD